MPTSAWPVSCIKESSSLAEPNHSAEHTSETLEVHSIREWYSTCQPLASLLPSQHGVLIGHGNGVHIDGKEKEGALRGWQRFIMDYFILSAPNPPQEHEQHEPMDNT